MLIVYFFGRTINIIIITNIIEVTIKLVFLSQLLYYVIIVTDTKHFSLSAQLTSVE